MIKRNSIFCIGAIVVFLCLIDLRCWAQRTGFPKEEFMNRRSALMEQVKDGIIILFADSMPQPGTHFKQDNDFYYFTGTEDMNAILMMVPGTKESILFLPQRMMQAAVSVKTTKSWNDKIKEQMGVTAVVSTGVFDMHIARFARKNELNCYVRLVPRDNIDNDRWETAMFIGRKDVVHYNDQISLDNYRVSKLKERYPFLNYKDITSFIDAMRVIKSPKEIEIMRRNGKISAEAIKKAMLATKPGMYEFELEAELLYGIVKKGARCPAFAPIIAAGANACMPHYDVTSSKIEKDNLVLIDFGADLDYLTMDITRTFPASGKFSKEQREAYQAALEVQKASIEAFRPGATIEDVRKHVDEVIKKKKIDARGLQGEIGHYVGMAVHDVGQVNVPLKEGMVIAVEPAIYDDEKSICLRIEDTVLITKDGCEVLTKDVPKEIAEIEALMTTK